MARAFIGLGSNLGDRLGFLAKALSAMADSKDVRVTRISGIYETEPFGFSEQPSFLNAVAELEVSTPPAELLSVLKDIEDRLGRTRREKWGPREIDLDILLYGDLIIDDESCSVPHAGLAGRKFVLIPLVELAPDCIDPKRGMTVSELLKICSDNSRVVKTTLNMKIPRQVA